MRRPGRSGLRGLFDIGRAGDRGLGDFSASICWSAERPREMRLFTVPTEIPAGLAICLYEWPSTVASRRAWRVPGAK
jgi:hypothetical protein